MFSRGLPVAKIVWKPGVFVGDENGRWNCMCIHACPPEV